MGSSKDDTEVLCQRTDSSQATGGYEPQRHSQLAGKGLLAGMGMPTERRYIVLVLSFALVATSLAGLHVLFKYLHQSPEWDSCTLGRDICEPVDDYTPEQLHLSLGANDREYYVTWATQKPVDTYLIWYKPPLIRVVKGQRSDGLFESDLEPGQKYRKHSYRAAMSVEPDAHYEYRVVACLAPESASTAESSQRSVCDENMEDGRQLLARANRSSKLYGFKSHPFEDPDRPLRLVFYGDLGLLNAQSVPRLSAELDQQDLIIHNGDFAYDLDTRHGKYGDRFLRLMEPISARIPYQTSVGNHEAAGNFSEYEHRFTMINRGPLEHGQRNNFFYSFDAGPVHFVAISTEFYYFLGQCGVGPLVRQYNWLKEDLRWASSSEQRAKRPWLVVFGHRPMYCSSRDGDDCSKDSNILRRGLPFVGGFALEQLLYEFGVDVELYSHEHQYERFLPIFDGRVLNGTGGASRPYHNARAPVHVISGSAGCQERLDPFEGQPARGSARRISEYGYTRVRATRCRLEFQQVSDDCAGTVVDSFELTKDRLHSFPRPGPALEGCQ